MATAGAPFMHGKDELNDLHKAFGKLKCPATCSDQFVPELRIRLCSPENIFDGFMFLTSIGEIAVINKGEDSYYYIEEGSRSSVWGGVRRTMSESFVDVN